MKNLVKSIVVIGLSLMLICGFTNYVSADNNVDWEDPGVVGGNITNTNPNSTNINTSNTNSNSNNNGITNTNTGSVNTNGNTNNNINNTNTNSKSSNSLAYTGSEGVNGVVAIAVVLGAFVAIYSFRKIQDYKNIK